MKWQNKGHEFDELGERFIKNKNFLIIGKEESCKRIKKKLEFLDANIKTIANVWNNDKNRLNLLKKMAVKIKVKTLFNNCFKGIVILADNNINKYVYKHLKRNIEKYNILCYSESEFFSKYLSIYAVYVADKLYYPTICLICTTVCTLNCKYCLNFTPYIKEKKHIPFEKLKEEADLFFSKIDKIGYFHISGGEPFAYPHFMDLIKYIYDNYRDKIMTLATSTNCTIIPSDELCQVMKDCNLRIECDDYSGVVPRLEEQTKKVIEKLTRYNINFGINDSKILTWFPVFPPKKNCENYTEEQLIIKRTKCAYHYSQLINGKLSSCNYSSFAVTADIIDDNEADYYDLRKISGNYKKELVEFRLGYSEKGYLEFCKYCDGLYTINKNKVPMGEQAEGLLECNICKEGKING